tara:strand:+ start:307 stop:555 length:249 start_codon:yes stop_codon:yes gene_type:complete
MSTIVGHGDPVPEIASKLLLTRALAMLAGQNPNGAQGMALGIDDASLGQHELQVDPSTGMAMYAPGGTPAAIYSPPPAALPS